jgi:signal transduction histidine kinase
MALYCWRRRSVPGALPLAAGSLCLALVLLATVPEVAATSAATKITWYRVQVIWQIPAATAMTCFVLEYTYPGRWLTRRNLALLALPPFLALLMVVVGHGRWMWRGLEVAPDGAVVPSLTPAGTLIVAYGLGLAVVNVAALLWLMVRSPQHRWPAALILLGMLVTRGLFLLDITHAPWAAALDPLVAGIILAWTLYAVALFGFHILDPLPAARTVAFEQMQEGMVILDARGRVASLNPAAERMLRRSTASAQGKAWPEVLPAFPDLRGHLFETGKPAAVSGLAEGTPTAAEISLGTGPKARVYALELSVLEDFRGLLIGHLLILRDVTEQHRAQAQVLEQQRTLAVLQERERLARELHDDLGQVLAFVNTQGQAIHRLLARDEVAAADEQVGRLVEVAREADADLRESILGLRVGLAEQSLWPALATYLSQYERRFGIHTELSPPNTLGDGAFEPQVEVQLLRIIQEALANARKHSRARCVGVTFTARDGWAQITVQDDGCGFDAEQALGDATGRVGLRVMRERAEEIGGTLAVQSAPGQGTEVIVRVPLAPGHGTGAG